MTEEADLIIKCSKIKSPKPCQRCSGSETQPVKTEQKVVVKLSADLLSVCLSVRPSVSLSMVVLVADPLTTDTNNSHETETERLIIKTRD